MAAEPLVSVITIFLNEEKFIQEAIAGVFAQTYKNWELLLVDDGSTDGSSETARHFARQNPGRVFYLEHKGHANRGMSASRNLGIAHAQGRHFAFVDADDVWLPHKLKQQVAILDREPEAGMVWGRTRYWLSWTGLTEDRDRDFLSELPARPGQIVEPPELLIRCRPLGQIPGATTCGLLIRREVIEQVGGFEESFRGWGEDQAFLVKVYSKAKVYISDQCVAQYRFHGQSCVNQTVSSNQERHSQHILLNWVNSYLKRQGIEDPAVRRAVHAALWPYRYPRLQKLLESFSRSGGSVWANLSLKLRNAGRRRTGLAGSIRAEPNPAPVTLGRFHRAKTTLSWESRGAKSVEVRVDRPDGPVFARSGGKGTKTTGDWVRDGTVFFLQDVTNGKPLTLANTLATVDVRVKHPFGRPAAGFPLRLGGLRERLSRKGLILLYHRVAQLDEDPWSLAVAPERFKEQLEAIKRFATPVSLPELVEALRSSRKLPRRFVAVTFDDGYTDNWIHAKPLLERYQVPATFFISSGYVGGDKEFWWDEIERLLFEPARLPESLRLTINGGAQEWSCCPAAGNSGPVAHSPRGWALQGEDGNPRRQLYRWLYERIQPLAEKERLQVIESLRTWAGAAEGARPVNLPLSRRQLAELAQNNLFTIGAHTVTHAMLPLLPAELQDIEISRGKQTLEKLTGKPVELFSYPYGRFTTETVELLKRGGFVSACTDSEGVVEQGSDPFLLPRLVVDDWRGQEFSRRLSACFRESASLESV